MGSISILFTNLAVQRKNSAVTGFEPGAAMWEAEMLPLCYAASPRFVRHIKYNVQKQNDVLVDSN